jgi:hypothetical protein
MLVIALDAGPRQASAMSTTLYVLPADFLTLQLLWQGHSC